MNARAVLAASLAFAVACGGDSLSGPAQAPAELTQVLLEMNPPSVGVATSTLSGIPMIAMGPMSASSCAYSAESQGFVCPTMTMQGLKADRSFFLLDASGHPQSQYDVHTTDGVRNVMTVVGTIGRDSMQMSMNDHSDMTLTGLLSGRHVLNGVQVTDMSGKDGMMMMGGGGSTFTTHTVTTTRDLVLPGAGEQFPKSGTISMQMTSELSGASVELMRMQLTFNGTNRVDVATTMGGFTTHCTIDLSSRFPFCA